MSTGSFLLKRGTSAQLGAITPLLSEPVFTIDTQEFRVGDGITPGGITPRNFSSPRSYPGSVSEVSAISTYTVQTWAALKALDVSNLSAGSSFYVKGMNASGDGRDGRYTYDPASTVPVINGLVLAPNVGAGRFLRDYTDVIDVFRDMGADNTATTDSGAIIQAALDFAANPTYGWAKDSGPAAGLGLAVQLHGSFISTVSLVLKGAVELRGALTGGRANDFGQYACIHSKHGGHCIVYDLNNDTPHYKLASIRNLFLVGYVETYIQGKKAIVSVTSRTVFKVAAVDAPVGLDSIPLYAANNVCTFFDNQGTCLGTGRVTSMTTASGETTITLEDGTDCYSSVNSSPGGLLTTACKVVFTPKVTDESFVGITDFYDPAAAGCTGIYCKNTHPTLSANIPVIENVYMRQFLVGLRVGPRCFGGSPGISNVGIMFCKVAGMCFPRAFATTDFFFNDQIYVHGGRRYDYGVSGITNTLDQPALAYGTYGMLGCPIASKFDRLLLEEVTLACLYLNRNIFTHINHLLCDGICGNGILVGPGYASYVAPASSSSHSNALHIGSFYARKKLDDGTSWDTIHTSTTPVAIRFEASTVSSGLPTYIYIGSAAIMTSQDFAHPTPKFVYAFDLGTRAGNTNRVRIGMLQERNGFIQMHKTGTKEVEFDDKSVESAAEVYTGWYWDYINSKRKYCDATIDIFSLSSAGVVAGGSGFSGIPLQTVSNIGTVLMLQKVGATPQRYSVVLSTNTFLLRDEDLNLYNFSLFCTTGAIQLWLGSNNGNSTAARSSNIYSENRVGGTDLAPSNLNIVAPGGTGAASANGAISFYTANVGASGTTPQGISLKLQLLREGQFRFQNLSPTSLGEGDLWFDSTKGFRQYFNAGTRPVGFKRVGTVTLVAGTATVSLGALITSATIIELTSQVDGGTPGFLRVSSRIDGVSFTITSSSNTDTSTVSWSLIEP